MSKKLRFLFLVVILEINHGGQWVNHDIAAIVLIKRSEIAWPKRGSLFNVKLVTADSYHSRLPKDFLLFLAQYRSFKYKAIV